MSNQKKLEEAFLHELQKASINVSIFLVNGIKLHGIIEAYDDQVITLKNTLTQMVYKHAISTVVPSRLIDYLPSGDSH